MSLSHVLDELELLEQKLKSGEGSVEELENLQATVERFKERYADILEFENGD